MRLTAAQALVRWMIAQRVETADGVVPFFAGVWAIFGHGNVAGLGEALAAAGDALPTLRAHSEQGMAHAAVAFAKAHRRERAMACTSSIGPGAANLVTAAAVAHINRLPLLLLPGDVFASRRPDPVLQQLERPSDPTATVNDCLRPVSRLFDRITRPEQLVDALPRAMAVLTDPAACGPVTICLCQDVQAEACDYPASLFRERTWRRRRTPADAAELADMVAALRTARAPLVIAGGGVLYARAEDRLSRFAAATGVPVAETQAGKGALPGDHPQALGGIGVTGTAAANDAAAEADVIVAIGTRLQDFTTGSRTLFAADATVFQVNVALHDVAKHDARPVLGDAALMLHAMADALRDWQVDAAWRDRYAAARIAWERDVSHALAWGEGDGLPSDAQVVGVVQRCADPDDVIVCAAGGLPGELHKLWRVARPGTYHAEYGFSCMGYEIAGGMGVALAMPGRRVTVMVGDGSYLMLNSEIATAAALGCRMTIVLSDNGGFGCIDRLQRSVGSTSFATLRGDGIPAVDFVAHARRLGAVAERAVGLDALEAALLRAAERDGVSLVVIATDPARATAIGGHWWDVPVAERSDSADVRAARRGYDADRAGR